MKSNREHVVRLVDRGLAILEARVGEPDLVFGVMTEKAMLKTFRSMGYDATVHGMRSSFRDWAAEAGFARDVAEAALGHAVAGSASEAAYLRTTLFQRRAKMMAAWAAFCAGKVATSDGVIALRA
jgi:integrase